MNGQAQDPGKRAAAEAAVAEVVDGMAVGLGTGSTAAFAIAALARRVREGLRPGVLVATSEATRRAAEAAGLAVADFAAVARLDLAIDGVDEVDGALRAIKGGGGALLREKIVAQAADRMIAIADASKPVTRLGARAALPVELLPFAEASVARQLAALGGRPELRRRDGRTVVTDNGGILFDCRFGPIEDADSLAARLDAIAGVTGHGLFLDEIETLLVGSGEGVRRLDRPVVASPNLSTVLRPG